MFNQPTTPNGSVIAPNPGTPFGPAAPGRGPQGSNAAISSQHFIDPEPAPKGGSLVGTLILIVVAIVAVVFIYLYITKYVEWYDIKTDIDGQVDSAVAMAVTENTTKMEEAFAEREKYPYRSFMGPVDYGSVGFEYPQTWNVFVEEDAHDGGDFVAYFNPGQVDPLGKNTINALRFTIYDKSFDRIIDTYNKAVGPEEDDLSFETRTVAGILSNLYVGQLPHCDLRGVVVLFKLRDKTVVFQTDAEIFLTDFYKVLDTVTVIQ